MARGVRSLEEEGGIGLEKVIKASFERARPHSDEAVKPHLAGRSCVEDMD